MNQYLYVHILEKTLVPFVKDVYPDSHQLLADNDLKHNSLYARDFLTAQDINWWHTPAESPDLNPIENVWHELKEYIRREVKPTRKEELVQGILQVWETVDVAKGTKYIRHLHKVIPKVVEVKGEPTGYKLFYVIDYQFTMVF